MPGRGVGGKPQEEQKQEEKGKLEEALEPHQALTSLTL